VRKATDSGLWFAPQRVILPSSGLEVTVCKVKRAYIRQMRERWPRDLVQKCDLVSRSGEDGNWTREEREFIGEQMGRIIREAFAEARALLGPALQPSPSGVIALDEVDTDFLIEYIVPDSLFSAGEPELLNGRPQAKPGLGWVN
jgi:hypothetical protein